MIAFRKRKSAVHKPRFFTGAANGRGLKDLVWHGTMLGTPDWTDPNARAVAFTLAGFDDDPDMHVMVNMHWDALDFELPAVPGRQWHLAINTDAPSPGDIAEPGMERPVAGATHRVAARTIVALISR
jgi:glycogen operon protein